MKNKRIILVTTILTTVLLLILLSFSYFLINASNDNREETVAGSALISLVYTDCSEAESSDCANISKNLEPGEEVTKTFRVENPGSMTLGFEIIFKSLINTFVNNELVYKVLDESGEVIVDEKPVPSGNSEGITIFTDSVSASSTKSYKLIVKFKELEIDQDANTNASYSITLGIKTDSTIVSRSTLNKLQSLNSDIKVKSVTPNFANISPLPSLYRNDGLGNDESSWSVSDTSYYITYGDDYVFNPTTGRYTLVNARTCKYSSCYTSLIGKYYCSNNVYSNTNLHYDSNQRNLYQITSNTTSTKVYYKTFEKTILEYDDKDSGLFTSEDNYGQTLYFRGNVSNNYVKFGKNSNNQDMYWRIVRINGDGSLRIMYDGTSAHDNGEASNDRNVGTSAYNTEKFDAGFVGYMYGNFPPPAGCSCSDTTPTGSCIYTCPDGGSSSYEEAHENIKSSDIKIYLDNWYLENIVNTGYSEYVADTIFCNDRTMRSGNLGYKQNITYFAYERLSVNKNPRLTCPQKNDAFTKSDTIKGNAKLTYPVGLITADELSMGGLVYKGDYNYQNYLYKGTEYWGMSADSLWTDGVSYATTGGSILYGSRTNKAEVTVVPVINLSVDYVSTFTGAGTKTNPFHGT